MNGHGVMDMPNVDQPAALPREERRSAKKIAEFFWQQYQQGLSMRSRKQRLWIAITSIMQGIHYFDFKAGQWTPRPNPSDRRKPRCVVPFMSWKYRWEHGAMMNNQFGVSTVPITGKGAATFYRAEQAQHLLTHWIEEEDIDGGFKDKHNQQLLYYGLSVLYRHKDAARQRVQLTPIPAPNIFPIPYDATDWDECDGIMRVGMVSKQWMEQQDAAFERKNPGVSFKRMADKAEGVQHGLYVGSPTLSQGHLGGGKTDGAIALTIWMKPTEEFPLGQYAFMLSDELYRYSAQQGKDGSTPLGGKNLPLEPVYGTKKPNEFLGTSFLEELVPSQLELNRQWTILVRKALRDRPLTFFDSQAIDPKKTASEDDTFIPMNPRMSEWNRDPVIHFNPAGMSRDVGTILQLSLDFGDKAAGHESRILFGEQEGRTEGGPATQLLNANAQTPRQAVHDRQYTALKRTLPAVLDDLKAVWPPEKTIRVGGIQNLGRYIAIQKENIPTSDEIIITPTPILPGGRNTMGQMLMSLRTMQSADGVPEVKSHEFRKSLRMLNLLPPGIEIADPTEQRIAHRISLLINDGSQPAVAPAGPGADEVPVIENHRAAVEMLRDKILEPGYRYYGPAVKKALLDELRFHFNMTHGGMKHPDAFDDDIEDMDAATMERFLLAAESDLNSFEGQVSFNGIPAGLAVA